MSEVVWLLVGSAISAVSGVIARLPIESRLITRTARSQYTWTAYQKLADTLGGPTGQVLDAANEFHRRIKNLEQRLSTQIKQKAMNEELDSWLENPTNYYYRSFIYRFVRLAAWSEAVKRITPRVDLFIPEAIVYWRFLQVLQFIRETATSVRLFEGMEYDDSREHAHIFSGTWSKMAQRITKEVSLGQFYVLSDFEFEEKFHEIYESLESVIYVLKQLDIPDEKDNSWSLRWARIKAVHYSCALLLANFGSHTQKDFKTEADAQKVLQTPIEIMSLPCMEQMKANLRKLEHDLIDRNEKIRARPLGWVIRGRSRGQ